ncbi:E3 ubiquitin-protein ligase rnf14 [Terramyces sp. JEL0728]|nr:E3 ubiquitin-protein ligase rnf14 [Terramyces sp. JEL0728]
MTNTTNFMNEQEQEIIALKGIYEDLFLTDNTLSIPIENNTNLKIENQIYEINHLPDIQLHFEYNPNYPESEYLTLKLECAWISNLQELYDLFYSWWEEQRTVVLFQIIDFLQHDLFNHFDWAKEVDVDSFGAIIEKLQPGTDTAHSANPAIENTVNSTPSNCPGARPKDIESQNNPNRAKVTVLEIPNISYEIFDSLLEFHKFKTKQVFEGKKHTCGICMESKPGTECFQFQLCKHVFCTDCITTFFKYLVEQGDVAQVCCPDQQCKKESLNNPINNGLHHIPYSDLQKLLTEKELDRYYLLFYKRSLQDRKDVTYCPRPMCQYPCTLEGEKKLVICKACDYCFCFYCNQTWHGYSQACQMRKQDQIIIDYMNSEDEVKELFELQFGKENLVRMVERYHSGVLTEEYLHQNSQKCPRCSTWIEKHSGCNHITCTCNCHFCFLCGNELGLDPLLHYSSGPCKNKLFHGAKQEFDEDGNPIFH